MRLSARGRAQADAQNRGDGAGSGVIGKKPSGVTRGFFMCAIMRVELSSFGFWAFKREVSRAQLPGFPNCSLVSAGGVGDRNGFAQLWTCGFVVALHPLAFASGIVRFTRA